MTTLNKSTFDEVVYLLAPQMNSISKRQDLVRLALYDAPMLLQRIDYEGDAQQFTIHVVHECDQFGQISPGRLAIVALLEQFSEEMSNEGQRQIETLITTITKTYTETPFEFVGKTGEGTHIFISYSRANLPLVQRLTRDLQTHGVNVWIDKIGLKPGTPDWENALREAIKRADGVILVASPQSRQSPYVRDELAIAKAANHPLYPVWVDGTDWSDCIPMGMGSIQFVDLRNNAYEAGLSELVSVLSSAQMANSTPQILPVAVASAKSIPLDFVPRNPYKGLIAFDAKDRGDFFGRDTLLAELLDALRFQANQPRFLAVIGASGSGKSSVIMAGLLPALQDGAVDNSQQWRYLETIVPGVHPLENLVGTLSDIFPEKSHTAIREDLNNPNTRGLHTLAKQAAKHTQLVLYIDQFEELFTLTVSETERHQFIDLLTTAVTEPDGALIVIISLRADFYDRPLEYEVLGSLINSQTVPVLPLTLADLYDVIEKPAQLDDVQITFEEGLVSDILFEVRDEVGALPLLQFMLDELFKAREGRTLTRAAYASMGGVRGALAQRAEQTYANLPSDDSRRAARALFLRLIEPGATEQDTTRRRADRAELTLPNPEQTRILGETVEIFVDARLLVSDEDTIEVAHEALIREWERLRQWLNDDRDELRLLRKLRADTNAWIEDGRQADYGAVYSGRLLREAYQWTERNLVSADEQAFLTAGREREAQLDAIEEQRKRELIKVAERAEKSRRDSIAAAAQARNILIVLICVGIFGVIAFFVANYQYVTTLDQTNITLTAVAQEVGTAIGLRETVSFEVTSYNVQQARAATQVAGLGMIPNVDMPRSPSEIISEATQIAILADWQPIEQEFDGVTMVEVPAGCFYMGSILSQNTQPIVQQCFDAPFWIGQNEVTNAQYKAFMDDGGYDDPTYWTEEGWSWRSDKTNPSELDHTQPFYWTDSTVNASAQPVTGINWYEASAYTVWLTSKYRAAGLIASDEIIRLPTEREWEYAARGPDSLLYPWGNKWDASKAVTSELGATVPAPVGNIPSGASWVGAMDMSGNAWEWVNTNYHFSYLLSVDDSEKINPNAPFVLRGGSFRSHLSNLDDASATYRGISAAYNRNDYFGLRVVLSK